MIKRRIAVLLTAALFSTTLLTGCDKTKNTGGNDSKPGEIKKLTAFFNENLTSTTMPWDTPVGKKIIELTGVKVEVEYLVGADARQKASIMIASGDYPDLINPGEATGDYIAAGALIPLDEYIEKFGTNIKKVYRQSELNLLKMQYGKTYYVSGTRAGEDPLYPSAGFNLAIDVLKDANWPKVTSLTQYVNIIRDYVKKNAEYNGKPSIGFTMPAEAVRMSGLQYGAARFVGGYPNDGPAYIDQKTLECKTIMTAPYAKDFTQVLNEMWNEGLIDKEMFMQTNDQYLAKISSGRVVGFYDQRWAYADAINALEKQNLQGRVPVAFPVLLDAVEKDYYRGPRAFVTQTGIAISRKCKDPEFAFKFLDRMAAEDIGKLTKWGIEGEDYSVQNGKMAKSSEQWSKYLDSDYVKKQGINQFDQFPRFEESMDPKYGKFSDGNLVSPSKTEDFFNQRYKDYEKDILKAYGIKTFTDFFAPTYPAIYEPGWAVRSKMPADHPGKIAVEKALEISKEYLPKAITASKADFNKLWDEYQGKLSRLDLKSFEDEMTVKIREGSKHYRD
jgi:putative aldouronate transport system substrate-binding protein